MIDREKVIKGLQNLREAIATDFIHEADQAVGTINDALELLKQQEAQKFFVDESGKITPLPIVFPNCPLKEHGVVKPKYNARTNWYECGNCHYSMTSGMHCRSELIPATKVRYCANCGFPVNWEGR